MESLWTQEIHLYLYKSVVALFGPYCEWQNKWSPLKNDKTYKNFCKEFAEEIGAKSAAAVMQQINWAIQTYRPKTIYQIKIWLKNHAAAFDAGFYGE
jgi:hypothetical protein